MSGKTLSCWACVTSDLLYESEGTGSCRRLSIAGPCIPDVPGPAAEAQCENLFCRIHPCTFLELRFTDTYETCRACPECEKDAYFKKMRCEFEKTGGTAADDIRSSKRFPEQGTGATCFLSAGGK